MIEELYRWLEAMRSIAQTAFLAQRAERPKETLPRTTQSSVDVVRAAAFNSRLSEGGKRSAGRRPPCAPLSRW